MCEIVGVISTVVPFSHRHLCYAAQVFDSPDIPGRPDFKFRAFPFLKKSDQLASALRAVFARHAGKKMNLRYYRHMTQAFAEAKLGDINWEEKVPDGRRLGSEVVNAQFGHSVSTGEMHYARDQHQIPGFSRGALVQHSKLSIGWAVAILGAEAAGEISLSVAVAESSQASSPGVSPALRAELQPATELSLAAALEPSLASAGVTAEPARRPQAMSTPLPAPAALVEAQPRARRRGGAGNDYTPSAAALRDATMWSLQLLARISAGVATATDCFRSSAQAIALAAVMERKRDVFAIMPTGGGKSFLFMVPALAESSQDLVTVVVVPLVALRIDLERRCVDARLNFSCWGELSATSNVHGLPGGICLIDVSRARSPDFVAALCTTAHHGRLARVVFDEVHLFSDWSTFRGSSLFSLSFVFPFLSISSPPPLPALSFAVKSQSGSAAAKVSFLLFLSRSLLLPSLFSPPSLSLSLSTRPHLL